MDTALTPCGELVLAVDSSEEAREVVENWRLIDADPPDDTPKRATHQVLHENTNTGGIPGICG